MKATVLIVEGEPVIVDAMQCALEEEGFVALIRSTGGDVPALLEQEKNQPDHPRY